MADLDLDGIERIANAATPGPWVYDDGVDVQCDFPSTMPYQEKNRAAAVIGPYSETDPRGSTIFTDDDVKDDDGAFIAAARTAVSALVAEVRRLREAEGRQRRIIIELKRMVERRNARLRATAVPVPCAEEEQRNWNYVAIRFDKAPSASMMGEAIGAAEAYIAALLSQIRAHESCAREAQHEIERLRQEVQDLKDELRVQGERE